jgi:nicotinamidase-related amidase
MGAGDIQQGHNNRWGNSVYQVKRDTIRQDGDTRGMDAWLPGLEPEPKDTIIFKKNPSAIFGTTLSTELQLMAVDTLVVCGVSISGCVRATTLDAMCYGFRPMVSYRFQA